MNARPAPLGLPHPALAGGPVYLDYNATTPADPRVTEAMLAHLSGLFATPPAATPTPSGPA